MHLRYSRVQIMCLYGEIVLIFSIKSKTFNVIFFGPFDHNPVNPSNRWKFTRHNVNKSKLVTEPSQTVRIKCSRAAHLVENQPNGPIIHEMNNVIHNISFMSSESILLISKPFYSKFMKRKFNSAKILITRYFRSRNYGAHIILHTCNPSVIGVQNATFLYRHFTGKKSLDPNLETSPFFSLKSKASFAPRT